MTTHSTEMAQVTKSRAISDIARVDTAAPLMWLRRGMDDFRRAPGLSLLYGALFAALCAGIFLLAKNVPWYALGYLTGLVVLGPFLASGLYVASRDGERGLSPSISRSLALIWKRRTYLALFSLLLGLVMAAWIRFSALLFAVKFSTLTPSIEAYLSLLSSSEGWVTLGYFIGIGLVLVASVFVASAVSIPLILDKDQDFITAAQTSFRAVAGNPGAMFFWASVIVVLTAIGIATAFVGFAVVFPVLGYATWHSYRALVK